MTLCNLCDTYLDAELTGERMDAYRKHLASCSTCRNRVDEWQAFETRLKKWAVAAPVRNATAIEAYGLMQQASVPKRAPHPGLHVLGWAAAALSISAAVAVILVNAVFRPISKPPSEIEMRIAVPGGSEILRHIALGSEIEAPGDVHLVAGIQKDTIGISPKGKLRVIRADKDRTQLSLERGTVACHVSKRKGVGEFVVEAGPLTVKVVGTSFSVSRDISGETRVAVKEGVVAVTDRLGQVFMLRAEDGIRTTTDGETAPIAHADKKSLDMLTVLLDPDGSSKQREPLPLETPATVKESLPVSTVSDASEEVDAPSLSEQDTETVLPKSPPLRAWQKWILSGRVEEAAQAVRRYLKTSPDDATVWALLADCERKEGRFQTAAKAYEKVILLGKPKQKARAVYMLASLFQSQLGDHERALELFNSYKQSSHAAPELLNLAEVNIVRSLIALGRCKEAKEAADRIRGQSQSVVSSNVDKMMEKCSIRE